MYILSDDQKAVLADREAQELYYVLAVEWPDGEGVKYYSRCYEPGVEPFMVEHGNANFERNINGFGSTGTFNVSLIDAYGVMKNKFDNWNINHVRCIVYMRSFKHKGFMLPLIYGRIKNGITWVDESRVLTFQVVTDVNTEPIRYTPNMGDIITSDSQGFASGVFRVYDTYPFEYPPAYVSSEFFRVNAVLNTTPWPDIYNYAVHVKATPLAHSPVAKVVKEVWDLTGGHAARKAAIAYNNQVEFYNKYERTIDNKGRKQYIDIPAASGYITIPVDNAQQFASFENMPIEIKIGDEYIIAIGSFSTEPDPDLGIQDPGTGYCFIKVADPRILVGSGEPDFDPDSVMGPPHNPSYYANQGPNEDNDHAYNSGHFNIPLYSNLRVFQTAYSDEFIFPDQEGNWPPAMNESQKRAIIKKSFIAAALANKPSFLLQRNEQTIADEEDIAEEELFNSTGGGLSKMNILYLAGNMIGENDTQFYEFDPDDYPWVEHCILEVEVKVNKQEDSLDPTLQRSTRLLDAISHNTVDPLLTITGDDPEFWDETKLLGVTYIPVLKQRGFACLVYNPYNHRISKILNVFKNTFMYKNTEKLTVKAKSILNEYAWANKGVIPAGAEIRMFNWAPENTYVVDSKIGTNVVDIRYDGEFNKIAMPSKTYSVSDVKSGELWSGYHPQCTAVYLGWSAMIRQRYAAKNGELYFDLENKYKTDEDIMVAAINNINLRRSSTYYIKQLFERNNVLANVNVHNNETDNGLENFLSELAFRNGKIIRTQGDVISLVNFIHGPYDYTQLPVINEKLVVDRSIVMGLTTDVRTSFDITFKGPDCLAPVYTRRLKENVEYYGDSNISWLMNNFDDVTASEEVSRFWMIYYSNIWRTMSLEVTMDLFPVDVSDYVLLDFKQQFKFSKPYTQITGSEVSGAQEIVEMYNCPAVVTGKSLDIERGTIKLQLWLPIIAGDTNKSGWIW
jgi:hypothetical protein